MTEQPSPDVDVHDRIKKLERKIRSAREALGEGEELPRLFYDGGDVITVEDQIVIPLTSFRAPGRLFMTPAIATDLVERVGSVLHARRVAAMTRVRELHVRDREDDQSSDPSYCQQDGEPWPCSTIVAMQGEGDE